MPDKEFEVIVIKMLPRLRRRPDEHREHFIKEMENNKFHTLATELKHTWRGP